jgi:hypothetical protein
MMNYCASICCVNIFPPMKSVRHNYPIRLQIDALESQRLLADDMRQLVNRDARHGR